MVRYEWMQKKPNVERVGWETVFFVMDAVLITRYRSESLIFHLGFFPTGIFLRVKEVGAYKKGSVV